MVIIGLGNIGERYENTRHNAGFIFVERLYDRLESNGFECSEWEVDKMFDAKIARVQLKDQDLWLVKPMLFMNLSGIVVSKFVEKKNITNLENELIIAHDDLDIRLGEYKIQFGVKPKVHNGVNNIEEQLKQTNFRRVRIGVDSREVRDIPGEVYVVQKMNSDDLNTLIETIDTAISDLISQLGI